MGVPGAALAISDGDNEIDEDTDIAAKTMIPAAAAAAAVIRLITGRTPFHLKKDRSTRSGLVDGKSTTLVRAPEQSSGGAALHGGRGLA